MKAFEDDSQFKVGAGYSHVLTDEGMDSIFESLKGQGPALSALLADGGGFLSSLENSASSGGNLAVEPAPASCDLGDSRFDPDDFLNTVRVSWLRWSTRPSVAEIWWWSPFSRPPIWAFWV